MESQEEDVSEITSTRIAVYDDFLSAPRIIDIEPSDIARYIEEISSKTYELAQQKGSSIPYTVIREVCENFIHAQFKNPCISILEDGNTIKFTDQGPGITDKQRAQHPGFTSATSEMRKYIRGVGSGLPIVKDYLFEWTPHNRGQHKGRYRRHHTDREEHVPDDTGHLPRNTPEGEKRGR